MRQLVICGGPFTGQTADAGQLDGSLRRFVLRWRVQRSPAAGDTLDWACLYHLDGSFDRTLEGEQARRFYPAGDAWGNKGTGG